jgi:hypothetical protein
MIATIAEGHAHLADWLFLIAAILALLGAVAYAPKVITPKLSAWAGTLVAAALCLVAVAWLVL